MPGQPLVEQVASVPSSSLRCSPFPRAERVWRLPQDAQRLPLGPGFGQVRVRLERVPRGLRVLGTSDPRVLRAPGVDAGTLRGMSG
jgi:hypothetical protein